MAAVTSLPPLFSMVKPARVAPPLRITTASARAAVGPMNGSQALDGSSGSRPARVTPAGTVRGKVSCGKRTGFETPVAITRLQRPPAAASALPSVFQRQPGGDSAPVGAIGPVSLPAPGSTYSVSPAGIGHALAAGAPAARSGGGASRAGRTARSGGGTSGPGTAARSSANASSDGTDRSSGLA